MKIYKKIGHLCVYFAYLPDFGAVDRNCAFSGAPRQTIINRLFCRQSNCYPNSFRQNILLPQNGSNPQFLSRVRDKQQEDARLDILFLWCGRQELKTPIYSKSPLFIRHSSTERQRGRQNYKKIAMARGRYKYSSVSLKSPFVKTIGLLIAFLYFWAK